MRFSPLLISSVIIKPLRYFFSNYAGNDLKWDEDPKKSTIEIGNVNDFHGIALQQNPRILINRGNYVIDKSGLTDNLAQSKSLGETKGSSDRINLIWIRGQASITIEARQEGTCDLVADMVSHFLVWSRPLLCDTQGFNEFALPLQISDCQPTVEDVEKFKVDINVPWSREEHWRVKEDALRLKGFFIELAALE